MADPPGKVLSSLTSSASSDKHSSKLGGCAGVFFQLFDRLHGKRLFPQKLLPAERKQVSRARKDEKLPMAKLLLIADENRGGFPRCDSPNGSIKEVTPEKKKKRSGKKAPGVVARLMGLESMPSPEPRRSARWDFEHENTNSMLHHGENACVTSADSKPNKQKHVEQFAVGKQHMPSSSSEALRNYSSEKENVFHTDERHSSALTRHHSNRFEDSKPMFFCKLPVLSPRKSECTFKSILSPSKSHNKLLSPIKSPLSSKSAARLFEAAAKILEPNMQPSTRAAKNLGLGSHVVRPLLVNVDREDKCAKKGTQVQNGAKRKPQTAKKQAIPSPRSKQEKNASNGSDPHASLARSQSVGNSKRVPSLTTPNHEALRRSGSAKEEVVPSSHCLSQNRSVKEDAKTNYGQLDSRASREDKMRPALRNQEQTFRRLSQPFAKSQSLRKGGPSQERDLSSHKTSFEKAELNMAKKPTNARDSAKSTSSDSNLTAVSSNSGSSSNGSSGILNYSRLFSSSKAVTGGDSSKRDKKVSQTSQRKGDSSLMKSLLKRRASSENPLKNACRNAEPTQECGQSETMVLDNREATTVTTDVSLSDKSSSETQCITECSSVDQSCTTVFEVESTSDSHVGNRQSCEVSSGDIDATQTLSVCAIQSSCDSCNLQQDKRGEDVADTASSNVLPESYGYKRKETVSYSGKTTAAILQELLTALNSSRMHIMSDEAPQNKSDCSSALAIREDAKPVVSCTSENTECTRLLDCNDDASSSSYTEKCLGDIKVMPRESIMPSSSECDHKFLQPSPISTLHYPFQDEYSDSWNNSQDQAGHRFESLDCSTTVSSSFLDSASTHSKRMVGDPSELLNAISRMHHIDISSLGLQSEVTHASESEKDYVKVIVAAAKLSPEEIYSAQLQLSGPPIDPLLFKKIEEKYQFWEWGIFPGEEDISSCTSEVDWNFLRSQYDEAAVHNRKLVFDCVREALSLNLGMGEETLQHFNLPILSSAATLSCSIARQLKDWREMGCSMNVDDMVEKEMNMGVARWTDFSSELSEIAVEMEGNILKGLVEELVIELWPSRMKFPVCRPAMSRFAIL